MQMMLPRMLTEERYRTLQEVIPHHCFRTNHGNAESPHDQQMGGDVFARPAEWIAFINDSWSLVAFRWSQLTTQLKDFRSGHSSQHRI